MDLTEDRGDTAESGVTQETDGEEEEIETEEEEEDLLLNLNKESDPEETKDKVQGQTHQEVIKDAMDPRADQDQLDGSETAAERIPLEEAEEVLPEEEEMIAENSAQLDLDHKVVPKDLADSVVKMKDRIEVEVEVEKPMVK